MLFHNVTLTGNETSCSVLVENDRISRISDYQQNDHEPGILFSDAIAFPGLINSHDHLDFNLFSPTGNRIYSNYTEWGKDIHLNNKESIDAVTRLPQELRTAWGIYKNLLCGVTTVVNHGERLNISTDAISIFQDTHPLHSVQFERKWRIKLNMPGKAAWPFVIHAGEGTDKEATDEIDTLLCWNIFRKNIIAVHGVAMTEEQAKGFKGLVWCPVSNDFLLGKTADIVKLKHKLPVVFGTDSTLTSGWNIWDHLRFARKQQQLSDQELFDAVTLTPAGLWGMEELGSLKEHRIANMVIAEKKAAQNSLDGFFETDPESILLVLHKGRPSLFDERIKDQLLQQYPGLDGFSMVGCGKNIKYVKGNLPDLIKNIQAINPAIEFPVSSMLQHA